MSAHRPPPPPDFPLIIRTIQARGMNCRTIARKLHVSPSCVHRWLMGDHMPSYHNSAALLFLAGVDDTLGPDEPKRVCVAPPAVPIPAETPPEPATPTETTVEKLIP